VKSITYAWTDTKVCPTCIANDGKYQPGEEGAQTASALNGNIRVDSDLFPPMSTQATAYVERELSEGLGARVGFVYYTINDQIATMQGLRPASAYTVPFAVRDPSTGDALTFFGIPNSMLGSFPTTQIVMNTPQDGVYKTVEASVSKRQSRGFSAGGGFGHTWFVTEIVSAAY
jgi:hypothetical protein